MAIQHANWRLSNRQNSLIFYISNFRILEGWCHIDALSHTCPQMFGLFSFPQSNLWQDINLFYLRLVFVCRWKFSCQGVLAWTLQFDLNSRAEISVKITANWKYHGLTKQFIEKLTIRATGSYLSYLNYSWGFIRNFENVVSWLHIFS